MIHVVTKVELYYSSGCYADRVGVVRLAAGVGVPAATMRGLLLSSIKAGAVEFVLAVCADLSFRS